MGWSEVAARNHARRLEREGWLERCPMTRGRGSLFLATRKGILVLGLRLIAVTTPAPTWWPHDGACAWTAAWLTVRGRTYLGPVEILDDPEWSAQLHWLDCHSFKRSWHRPDLVGFMSDRAIAIEVELAPKSKPRLDAILQLHLGWIVARKNGRRHLHLRRQGRLPAHRAGRRADRAQPSGQALPNRTARHDQGADPRQLRAETSRRRRTSVGRPRAPRSHGLSAR